MQLGSHFGFPAAGTTQREASVSVHVSISLRVLYLASGNEICLLFQRDSVKTTYCLEYIHFKLEKKNQKNQVWLIKKNLHLFYWVGDNWHKILCSEKEIQK